MKDLIDRNAFAKRVLPLCTHPESLKKMLDEEPIVFAFDNDPFSLIMQAFINLYGKIDCTVQWNPNIEACGETLFADDGKIVINISTHIPIENCTEIFAHELAHVAVGVEHNHDTVWRESFEMIYEEYIRIIQR